MKMNEKHEAFAEKEVPQLYKIGMFAQMNHITIKALRFYEEQGLLSPAFVDSENGYRYYTMSQMADIQRITALKQAGFTLEEIKLINQGADAASLLASKKAALLKKIAELTSQIAVIDGYLSGPANALDTPVLIRKIPAVIVATMKKRIDSYDELFSFMPEMGAEQGRCRVNPYNIFYNAHSSYRYFYHLNFLQLSFHLFFLSDSRNRASCFFSFFLKYKNNPKKRIISNPPNPHRKILVPISSLTIPITTMQTPSTIITNMQMSDNIDSLLYLFIQYP